ncbi:MAG: NAD(P)H-dependent oxidoreductase subunit E [Anaerolineaceae bacterium]|nr:NAD(P)H-dependent oxidoreductase subunit E [Anaerolineaceae bacterium]
MLKFLETIPATDPLAKPEQRQIIDQILEENKDIPGGLMVILNELQNRIGFISLAMQQYVSHKMRIPTSTVHGVVSFYSFFTTTPRGRHTVKFCMGTACYVGGVPQLIEKAKQTLGVDPGQTTPDGNVTIELCRCVGACSQAPVVVVDEEVHGRVRPNKFPQILRAVLDQGKQTSEQQA